MNEVEEIVKKLYTFFLPPDWIALDTSIRINENKTGSFLVKA